MKEQPGGDWKDVLNPVAIALKKDKNEIVFRVINLSGAAGPEHKVIIDANIYLRQIVICKELLNYMKK